ncbi:MAG: hypothetical protein QNJ15_04510 [Erythrobacter sp.]|nr:hypothetical protein [Erythrobacter sp.]
MIDIASGCRAKVTQLFAILVSASCFAATPASAGKKDDAWAACIWETVPASAANWVEMPMPERRQGIGEIKPEFALKYRLQAACFEKLTKEGKKRPHGFNDKKVRKALIAMKPDNPGEDTIEPLAYVCRRYFRNDTEFERPAGYRWGFGPDTSQAQFFSLSFVFAGGGGSLGEHGGISRCDLILADGSLLEIDSETLSEMAQ